MPHFLDANRHVLTALDREIAEGESRIVEIRELLSEGRWAPSDRAALLELLDGLTRVVAELQHRRSQQWAEAGGTLQVVPEPGGGGVAP